VIRLIRAPFSDAEAQKGPICPDDWPIFAGHGRTRGARRPSARRAENGCRRDRGPLRRAYRGRGDASEATPAVMGTRMHRCRRAGGLRRSQSGERGIAADPGATGCRYGHDALYPPTGLAHRSYLLTAEECGRPGTRGVRPAQ